MLKKAKKLVGIMMMILFIIIIGCSDKKTSLSESHGYIGGDGNNGAVHFGNELKLSGQVYLAD